MEGFGILTGDFQAPRVISINHKMPAPVLKYIIRLLLAALALIVLTFFLIGFKGLFLSPQKESIPHVFTGESLRPEQLLNIHEAPARWLSVNGRKYYDIVGGARPYLQLAQIDAVFFVTTSTATGRIGHFYFIHRNEETTIPINDYSLGNGIGVGKSGELLNDWFMDVAWPNIRIASRNGNGVHIYTFNLGPNPSFTVNTQAIKTDINNP
jgi:hypothetical protein